jgi:hypothetical protein
VTLTTTEAPQPRPLARDDATAEFDTHIERPGTAGAGDEDGGLDACCALVVEDDWLTRRQISWVLASAGAEVVLDTTATGPRCRAVVVAGLAAVPAVVVVGDLAGCDRRRLIADVRVTAPDVPVVVYSDEDPGAVGGPVTWIPKPDLESLGWELRRHLGTADLPPCDVLAG